MNLQLSHQIAAPIPLTGDAFDIFWKSNQKNVNLLLPPEATPVFGRHSKTGDWLFPGMLNTILVTVLAGSLAITLFIASRLSRWLLAD